MTTLSKDICHTIETKDSEGNALQICIRLNDECKNGHQDFAITATAWEKGKPRTDGNMIYAGCCHEEIIKARPDLQIFVNLHLCDYRGVPMYAIENGVYHMVNGFTNTPASKFAAKFCEYYRVTPEQFTELSKSEDQLLYAYNLQALGILDQWKAEADKAIKMLEEMTGKTFEIDSPKLRQVVLTDEQKAEIERKQKEGYYTEKSLQIRQQERIEAEKQKIIDEITATRDKAINKAEQEFKVKMFVLSAGLPIDNFIYYDHLNTGRFNWLDYKTKVSPEQFAEFLKNHTLPGVTFQIEKTK